MRADHVTTPAAAPLIEALRRMLGAGTELVETHISWLLLSGADAYKL